MKQQLAIFALLIAPAALGAPEHAPRPGGIAIIDIGDAAEAMPELVNAAGVGCYWTGERLRIETKFERRGLRLGHRIFDIVLRRRETV